MTGVAITTLNRRSTALATLKRVQQFTPGAKIVVVDDGSDEPFSADVQIVRHDTPLGIARAKNRCLAELEGCDHIFLLDDDCFPIRSGWTDFYQRASETSGMHHFCLSRGRDTRSNPFTGLITVNHVTLSTWARPCGCMLYASATALERVGGMDPRYGRWGNEHIGWSYRIHNAGLTTRPFLDVPGSQRFMTMLDDVQGGVERSIGNPWERRQMLDATWWLLSEEKASAAWKPFRF